MALDGKDLMAAAKATLASTAALVDESHSNRAAERELTCEEISCIALDLQNALKFLQEVRLSC